ncbi:MAG: CGNR zinc finger domain-containing protein [Ignavibacteriales bacterium]
MEFACLDLLNSDWHDHRGTGLTRDRLDDRRWLEEFLDRWGLAGAGLPDEQDLARLKGLRSLLRRIVEAMVSAQQIPRDSLEGLNRVMANSPSIRRLSAGAGQYRLEILPAVEDWTWVLSEIAASFADLLAHHDPTRIKICRNPDCHWVFYDDSRSRTRRWCEDTCGNLMKVRRFRARNRDS